MRTKALLLSAAIGAALAPTAMAQVYSVNAVGYINLPEIAPGNFAIIANQLDNGAGNMLSDLIPVAPEGTVVYAWDVSGQQYLPVTFDEYEGGWIPATTAGLIDLSPGKAVFVLAPAGAALNITFVGDVPQAQAGGTLQTTYPTDGGFALIASQVPQAGNLVTALKYTPADQDVVYRFDVPTQQYLPRTYDEYEGGFLPVDDLDIAVGEGFFLKAGGANSGVWARAFDINDPNS
jgi:hypothetical protein